MIRLFLKIHLEPINRTLLHHWKIEMILNWKPVTWELLDSIVISLNQSLFCAMNLVPITNSQSNLFYYIMLMKFLWIMSSQETKSYIVHIVNKMPTKWNLTKQRSSLVTAFTHMVSWYRSLTWEVPSIAECTFKK